MTDDIDERAAGLCDVVRQEGRHRSVIPWVWGEVHDLIAAALRAEREKALREAAAVAGTMAERPYDLDPEFSAVLNVEAAILRLIDKPASPT